jgi:hypothetical protein
MTSLQICLGKIGEVYGIKNNFFDDSGRKSLSPSKQFPEWLSEVTFGLSAGRFETPRFMIMFSKGPC